MGEKSTEKKISPPHFSPQILEHILVSLENMWLENQNKFHCILDPTQNSPLEMDIELNDTYYHPPLLQNQLPQRESNFDLSDISIVHESIQNSHSQSKGVAYTPYIVCFRIVEFQLSRIFTNTLLSHCFKSTSSDLSIFSFIQKCSNPQELHSVLNDIKNVIMNLNSADPCVGTGNFVLPYLINIIFWLIQLQRSFLSDDEVLEYHAEIIQIAKIFTYFPSSVGLFVKNLLFTLTTKKQEKILADLVVVLKHIDLYDIDETSLRITSLRIKTLLQYLFGVEYHQKISNIFCEVLKKSTRNFLQEKKNTPKYDLIFGNPPYISSDSMVQLFNSEEIERMKIKYAEVVWKRSKPDIYFYFIQQAINQLKDGGFLGFIIPNRIMINHYAQKLRKWLIVQSKRIYLVELSNNDPEGIFAEKNVHTCLMFIEKEGNSTDHSYYCQSINNLGELSKISLAELQWVSYSSQFIYQYPYFLSSKTKDMCALLERVAHYPKLSEMLSIHEGYRIHKKRIPEIYKFRITSTQRKLLDAKTQSFYLMEIRGRQISDNIILASNQFIFNPNLFTITQKKDASLTEEIDYFYQPMLIFRELGKKVFCGTYPFSVSLNAPIFPYGGVYFCRFTDIKKKALKSFLPSYFTWVESTLSDSPSLFLWAFQTYFQSEFYLSLYSSLYATGSWGSALKFRSSYLVSLPFIPFPVITFGYLGFYSSLLETFLSAGKPFLNNNMVTKIESIETDIENLREKLLKISLQTDVSEMESHLQRIDEKSIQLHHIFPQNLAQNTEINEINTILGYFKSNSALSSAQNKYQLYVEFQAQWLASKQAHPTFIKKIISFLSLFLSGFKSRIY